MLLGAIILMTIRCRFSAYLTLRKMEVIETMEELETSMMNDSSFLQLILPNPSVTARITSNFSFLLSVDRPNTSVTSIRLMSCQPATVALWIARSLIQSQINICPTFLFASCRSPFTPPLVTAVRPSANGGGRRKINRPFRVKCDSNLPLSSPHSFPAKSPSAPSCARPSLLRSFPLFSFPLTFRRFSARSSARLIAWRLGFDHFRFG